MDEHHGVAAIQFELPAAAEVTIEILDPQGRLVRSLLNGSEYDPGYWSIAWDRTDGSGRKLAPGIYLYRMKAGQFRDQRKMLLLP